MNETLKIDIDLKNIKSLVDRVIELENDIKEIHRVLEEQSKIIRRENLSPYRCPVCEGKGNIRQEVERGLFKFDLCNACKGKGVLWK